MLRRALVMALAPSSRGRAPRPDNVPLSKGGRGRHYSSAQSKPPLGPAPLSAATSVSAVQNSVVSRLGNLSVRDSSSGKGSASSLGGHVTRQPFSGNRRPVTIKNVDDLATLLREELVKNVVIVAGAGISTPSGIPDFRSPGTGLYDNLQQYSIPYAEAIFDIDFFHHNPRPFFTLAKELYPTGKYRPNYLHYFAKMLHDRGVLLRMYTQNIDGLERIAGIPAEKLVEAHGTFSTATCMTCRQKCNGDEIKDKIFDDKFPRCKRATCNGIVKPDIVFFGEELPKRFYYYLKDMLQADLVLIMGTSLEVQPFAGIIDTARFTIPRLLFNRMAVGPFRKQKRPKDFVAAGDLIEQMLEFVGKVGWTQEMETLITRREGYFKTSFPPPVPKPPVGADDKSKKAGAKGVVKADPLAAMWRQNAAANFYSDSEDSSESDSGVTPTDSDDDSSSNSDDAQRGRGMVGRRPGVGGGNRGGRGGMVGGRGGIRNGGGGKSASSSSVSSGCVSNASSSSAQSDLSATGPLLARRNNGGGNGGGNNGGGGGKGGGGVNSGPRSRSFGQNAAATNRTVGGGGGAGGGGGVGGMNRKGGSQLLPRRDADARKTAWTGIDGGAGSGGGGSGGSSSNGTKPPIGGASSRKPPLVPNSRGLNQHQTTQQQQHQPRPPPRPTPPPQQRAGAPPPGSHALKPRSHSVTKAVPEKLHTRGSVTRKAQQPRVQSAQPARLALHHRAPPPAYLACMPDLSDDSSSQEDHRRRDRDRDSDDTSDDSR